MKALFKALLESRVASFLNVLLNWGVKDLVMASNGRTKEKYISYQMYNVSDHSADTPLQKGSQSVRYCASVFL